MLKNIDWFKILFYFSLLFLIISLYNANYLEIPKIYSFNYLVLSFISLFIGMLAMCNNWRVMLKVSASLPITYKRALAANGLSVFTKYIPGKLLVIMGRALYTVKYYNISKAKASIISLKTQLITIWVGLIFSIPLMLFVNLPIKHLVIGVIFILFVTFFLHSRSLKNIILKNAKLLLNKKFDYPLIKTSEILTVLPTFIFTWGFLSIGFWLLCSALVGYHVSIVSGITFAFAATLGILVLIAPGGLGIREGLLAFSLVPFLNSQVDAITIATASRLWFLIGELFLFFCASIMDYTLRNKKAL